MGDLHADDDDSDCAADGHLPAILAARAGAGSFVDWIGAGVVCGRGGAVGGGFGVVGKDFYAERSGAGVLDYCVWICSVGAAGVAAAGAAGLFERVH